MKRHWITSRRLIVVVVLFWAALAGLSLERNLALLDAQGETVALERARMLFRLLETTRLWNARHGGVYAPAGEQTPPNPHLDVPDRDVVINGRPFTKVNPAYMTRQLAEMFAAQGDVGLRITSLKPIRPGNAADAWEASALRRLEKGDAAEVLELVPGAEPAYRYMAGLRVERECLQCHEKQGYQLGDLRGGIAVALPLRLIAAEIGPQRRVTIGLHVGVFLILAIGSALLLRGLQDAWARLERARHEQEEVVAERTAHLRSEMAERQRIAGELQLAVTELKHSNAELEQFAYAVSHDLQEPLRMVNGYAQLLERRHADHLDGDAREFLGYMVDGARRMNDMIADLLTYSRLGTRAAEPAAAAAGTLVEEALHNLAAAVAESGGTVQAEPLPEILADRAQVVRLFQNLIGNALKYRHPGRAPLVRLSARPDGERWRFTVADNGIGIDPEFHERIFMVFQRLHTRQDYPGTGVGLAICRRIVERHGGRIWVESTPGLGSAFHFTLPGAGTAVRPAAAE